MVLKISGEKFRVVYTTLSANENNRSVTDLLLIQILKLDLKATVNENLK